MRTIHCLILLCLLGWGAAYAQINLTPCNSSGYFHKCFVSYTTDNGDKYIGKWGDRSTSKEGVFSSPSSNKFVETLKGHGVATFKDEHKFVGEIKDGKPHGKGTLFDSDGSIINQGLWTDGIFQFSAFQSVSYKGQGTYTYSGNKYVGDWMHGMFNGQGSLYALNGRIVVAGVWTNDNFVRSDSVQQASLQELNASSCKKPEYPATSKRLEEQGKVQVLLSVEADGKVNAALGKSSGFKGLDIAAVRAASDCQFKPAIFGGVPQQSWARMNFTFQLE